MYGMNLAAFLAFEEVIGSITLWFFFQNEVAG